MLLPESSVPDGPDALSVVFHVGAYAVLAATLVRPAGLSAVRALALVALSAVATEALQLLAEGRSADPWDVVADLIGGAIGAWAATRWGPALAGRLSEDGTGAAEARSARR